MRAFFYPKDSHLVSLGVFTELVLNQLGVSPIISYEKSELMRKSIPSILFLCLTILATGQEKVPCFTDELTQEMLEQNPELKQKMELAEQKMHDWRHSAHKKAAASCDVRIIPTVVHIIHNGGPENISDTKVEKIISQTNAVWLQENYEMSQLDELWHDVATNMKVELRLAKIDPDGKPTTGIIRTQSAFTNNARDNVKTISRGWDKDKYLNIWLVRSIQNSSGQGIVLGYAYFPTIESRTSSGIVARYDVGDRYLTTMAHELGHYLNLYHPFQGSCGTSDCSSSGDYVCDTPPRFRSNQDCPLTLNSCSNDSPDQRDQVENIMDYTSCRRIFTEGQKERVDFTFSEFRDELISIDNLFATGVVDSTSKFTDITAGFTSDETEICAGGTITFNDKSCTDSKKTTYTWIFDGGTPKVSFDRNPKVSYSKSGFYDVTLVIENGTVKDSLVVENHIRIVPNESEIEAPIYEDFEEELPFPYDQWTVIDDVNDVKWQITDKAASSGKYCLMLNNGDASNFGQVFTINLPAVDMSKAKKPILTFDLAYARKNQTADREDLKVYVKDGCDGFDMLRYNLRASSMATVSGYETSNFTPSGPGEWENHKVDLSQFEDSKSLRPQIRFTAQGGNHVYIDNISVGDWSLDVDGPNLLNTSRIYPNPATDLVNLEVNSSLAKSASISVYNGVGAIAKSMNIQLQVGLNDIQLNTKSLPAGMYYIFVETSTERSKHKLVIE